MTLAQSVQLEIDGAGATLRVMRLRGTERLHAPYAYDLLCGPERPGDPAPLLPIADLVGKPAKIAVSLPDETERVIEGLVDTISASSAAYSVTIVPKVALLADAADYLVFLDEDAAERAKQVLSEHGIDADVRVARSLTKRPQRVLAFETRLDFVSRILAEEGIAWYLPVDKKDVLILTDRTTGFEDTPGLDSLAVRERSAAEA